jgi:O-antigen/teichoic acid export membrane protein
MWGIVLFKFSASFSFSFDIKDLTDTIKFSFPIFVSYIAYFFISKYSIIILQKHISLENIGLFSLSHQIASIPSLITIAITKASQPYLFSSKSDDELKLRAIKFDSSYKLIMIWLVGSMIFSVDIIFNKFLPVSYYPAHNVAKYLLLISLIYNFSIVENSILLYYMKSKIILIITITGSILNIVLCNILVYKYSINGILISMLIAFSVNFLLDIYFSAKHFKLKYDVKSIIVCAFIIISYLIISSDNYPSLNKYSFLYSIFGFLILTIIICALLNKLNRGSIKTIYNI